MALNFRVGRKLFNISQVSNKILVEESIADPNTFVIGQVYILKPITGRKSNTMCVSR
jgi:hypothetical protein